MANHFPTYDTKLMMPKSSVESLVQSGALDDLVEPTRWRELIEETIGLFLVGEPPILKLVLAHIFRI